MARVKRNKIAAKRRRNVLALAKGYIFRRSKTEVGAKVAIRKAGAHAFDHRKDRKTDARRYWTTILNVFLRENGTTYSKFINSNKTKNIELDRKVMSQMAQKYPEALKSILS